MWQFSFLIVDSLSTTRKSRPRRASPVTGLAHLNLSSNYCTALETLAGPDLSGWPSLAKVPTSNPANAGLTEKMDSLSWTGSYHWKRWAEESLERLGAWPLLPATFGMCGKRQQLSLWHFLAWGTINPTPAASPLRLPHKFSCFSNKTHYWIETASGKAQKALANQGMAPKHLLRMCWILCCLIDSFAVCEQT